MEYANEEEKISLQYNIEDEERNKKIIGEYFDSYYKKENDE